MSKRSKARKVRAQIREHARMAALLLPPTPKYCPPYTRLYFESYRNKFFEACRNSRHRHCPKTASHNSGRENFYCNCPCHLPKMSKYKRRQMWLQLKVEYDKAQRKKMPRVPRAPGAPKAAVGAKGQKKAFRYVKAPATKIPAGIMHCVHTAIVSMGTGTVLDVSVEAIKNGLDKVTSQNPVTQTSIMLHRLLKAGVVEAV